MKILTILLLIFAYTSGISQDFSFITNGSIATYGKLEKDFFPLKVIGTKGKIKIYSLDGMLMDKYEIKEHNRKYETYGQIFETLSGESIVVNIQDKSLIIRQSGKLKAAYGLPVPEGYYDSLKDNDPKSYEPKSYKI